MATTRFETIGHYEDGHCTQLGEHDSLEAAQARGRAELSQDHALKEVDVCPIRPESRSPTEDAVETLTR